MKSVCIVQARLNSRRLPRKVLLPLNRHTVIGEVLTRCWQIPRIDYVCCVIPVKDDDLAIEAMKYSDVIRGPEDDVLARYSIAARELKADVILRVTADCPLLCPELCAHVMEVRAKRDVEYCSNVYPKRTFPQGYDCECFTYDLLERAFDEAETPYDREHVTPWMQKNAKSTADIRVSWQMDGRLTLDTEDDYRVICAAFGHDPYKRLHAA